jgi:hypothetical protein
MMSKKMYKKLIMKKLVSLFVMAVFFFSCNEAPKETPEEITEVVAEPVKVTAPMPFPATLTSDWKIGDPEKIRIVLTLYKNLINDSIENGRQFLADSILSIRYDNRRKTYSADEFIKLIKDFRGQFKSLDEKFQSYVCLHSDSLNIDMVSLWLEEDAVWKNGKLESTLYQENWYFNKDGKIYRRGGYSRFGY